MTNDTLDLPGIDGANPLGFLAALGTLTTLHQTGEAHARLWWKRGRTWIPLLDRLTIPDPLELSHRVAGALRGRQISADDEKDRAMAQRQYDTARKAVVDKKKEIRARGLGRKEREAAFEQEVRPLERARDELRPRWLDALKKAVPRPELAIGKRLDCTPQEYRQYATDFLAEARHDNRETLDLLASFGSDSCREERADAILPTPFCFIKGSGQQFFLETVRQLMELVTPERVYQTLFEPWGYRDEQFSMRWDPCEDRRYALMDRNPTAPGNESKTVWMANLLAYRALSLFPSAPGGHSLATTAWTAINDDLAFTWPIWGVPATPDTTRSLLQQRELHDPDSNRASLQARGVTAVFRSYRIKVGAGQNYKLNFTPAQCV